MIRRPPRSTLDRSSAASDVYKRQVFWTARLADRSPSRRGAPNCPVSYTHLRAHETGRNLVCRLLLEKKKKSSDQRKTQLTAITIIQASAGHTKPRNTT